MDGLLHYLSDPGDDQRARLYIPEQIRDAVIRPYHDDNGHVGINKTFEAIERKYYPPKLYQRLTDHINACVTCQT